MAAFPGRGAPGRWPTGCGQAHAKWSKGPAHVKWSKWSSTRQMVKNWSSTRQMVKWSSTRPLVKWSSTCQLVKWSSTRQMVKVVQSTWSLAVEPMRKWPPSLRRRGTRQGGGRYVNQKPPSSVRVSPSYSVRWFGPGLSFRVGLSESVRPSRSVRVVPSESVNLSRSIRVGQAESVRPSHPSESVTPSRSFRVIHPSQSVRVGPLESGARPRDGRGMDTRQNVAEWR